MTKYIPLDALVAEIERRLWLLVPKMTFQQQRVELEKLLSFLDTLEVKEVDLDFTKEVDMWIEDNGDTNGFFNVQDLAKHFFELALSLKNS